jgi:imidazolonepropionase-like amidohydrolase
MKTMLGRAGESAGALKTQFPASVRIASELKVAFFIWSWPGRKGVIKGPVLLGSGVPVGVHGPHLKPARSIGKAKKSWLRATSGLIP